MNQITPEEAYAVILEKSRVFPSSQETSPFERVPTLYPCSQHRGPRYTAFTKRPFLYERELTTEQIDISIVTYNSSKWLDMFFSSLCAQHYPLATIRLLCMDNGSTDDTLEKLVRFQMEQASSFTEIRISKGPNEGYGAGHNRNLAFAASRFFLVTNVDLEFESNSLVRAVGFAQQDTVCTAAWELRQKPYEHPKYYDPVDLTTSWNSGACTLYRTDALQDVKGFDTQLFMYCEDVDLSFRLRDAGYLLRYLPWATVWHYCYEDIDTPKPLQLVGSLIGNAFLRARFGNEDDENALWRLVVDLAEKPELQTLDGQREMILHYAPRLLEGLPYFRKTRKRSQIPFRFRGLDFEVHREGATCNLTRLPEGNEAPLISVIVRTYGKRSGFLREALTTLCNQTYEALEVIVVEDGGTWALPLVREIAAASGMSIQYIALEKQGRCMTGNAGLDAASGEFLLFFDDDDLLWADHVEVLVQTLVDNPQAPAAYSLSWALPTQVDSLSPLAYVEAAPQLIPSHRAAFSQSLMKKENFITIQSVLFRKNIFLAAGGLDVRLEVLEDWNLWLRYMRFGSFAYVKKTTSLFRLPLQDDKTEERVAIHKHYYNLSYETAMKNDVQDDIGGAQFLAHALFG